MHRLEIAQGALEQLIVYCKASYPLEVCGVLLGSIRGDAAIANEVRLIPNRAHNPASGFRFDGPEWVRLLYEAERSGFAPVGLFHSHPDAPPVPSAEDEASVWLGLPGYWIVSLTGSPFQTNVAVFRPVFTGAGASLSLLPADFHIR